MVRSPVIVLGMHRSGTSCLAGSLQEAGLYLGDVIVSAPHNKKGNRELKDVWSLHERVLNENGGSWRSPPKQVSWSSGCIAIQRTLIDRLAGDFLWGFKDPRTLLVYKRWLDEFPDARLVATVRHPDAVAASLMRRDSIPYVEAVRLWVKYNQILLCLASERRVAMVEFGTPMDYYQQALGSIALELGLNPPQTFKFPTHELVHNQPGGSCSLPSYAADLFLELKEKIV